MQIPEHDDAPSIMTKQRGESLRAEGIELMWKQDLHKEEILAIVPNISQDTESTLDGNHFNLFQSRIGWEEKSISKADKAHSWCELIFELCGNIITKPRREKKLFLLTKLSRCEDCSLLALLCISKKVIIECCWRSNERKQQEKGRRKFFVSKVFPAF